MVNNKVNHLVGEFKRWILSRKRLHLIFWAIGGLILTSTTFSTYFMHRLGEALEITIRQNMPILTSALHLSEQSSMLSATAPVLAVSDNEKELGETYFKLKKLLNSISEITQIAPYANEFSYTQQLGQNTQKMAKVLIKLKDSTAQRLSLAKNQVQALVEIQAVQRNLTEVLNPVEYGVISLTNLFGRRTARRIIRHHKQLGENSDATRIITRLNQSSNFINTEISNLTEVAIKDMGYALTLKASGNNLINLLFILSESETNEQISSLQSQYANALTQFNHATGVFEQSALAQRNPVLSNNVHLISDQFKTLSLGVDSLFTVKSKQLITKKSTQKFLMETRKIATEMSEHSKNLADHVDQRIQKLQEEMKGKRKTGIYIVTFVSGGCLLLTCFIAFGTIIAIKQQEEALQHSHDQLEHRVKIRTQELQQSYQQLAHADRLTSLGEMATGIAHEINQPLNIINLASQILKRYFSRHDCNAPAGESVKKIEYQVERAANIIKNMRSFARTNSNPHQAINLAEPAELALSFFKEQFRLHQIHLTITFADNLPLVQADAQKFEQVVVNLLSNARYAVEKMAEAANDDYQKQIIVRLFHHQQQRQVIFEITDNGIGMNAKTQKHCLEPFFTTKEIGQGTGMGMSITHNIVTEFGGGIDVESIEGKGCTFRILIPEANNDE